MKIELERRRIRMTEKENEAVDALIAEYGQAYITRAEPNDEGALLVEISGRAWEITEDGAANERGE